MKYFLSVPAFWPPSRPKPPAPPSSHRGQYELTLGRTWPGGATTGDSHPMDPWTHRHRRHRPSLTSLYIVAYCGCFCHVAFFFLLANLLQLHFPVGKLQLRLQVCHFAGRDHVEAKGKVGENPVKLQKISQYLCSKI